MRIAQVAPPFESVPPKKYGGTERVVSALTEELVAMGHDVTLFASGDSQTSAKLVSSFPKGIREMYPKDMESIDIARRMMAFFEHLSNAYRHADEFDIIHDHTSMRSLPIGLTLGQYVKTPVVSTLHSMLGSHNIPDYERFTKPYLVAISQAQMKPAPNLNYISTVHNGLDMEEYPFSLETDKYLLFVGRICMEKGVHNAITIAKRLQMPLIIAAKLDQCDKPYFDEYVKPQLDDKNIRWIGEVDETERNRLMSKARCLLHPLTWEEPFGLTLVESLACGTPIAALDKGSMPEIIQQGKTGWIADSVEELAEYIRTKIDTIDRKYCRMYALKKFSAKRMATEYETIYETILGVNQYPYSWFHLQDGQ